MGAGSDRTKEYGAEDLGDVLKIAVQMYEAEKQRGNSLERKGAQLIGFGGIVTSLSALAIGNMHQINVFAQLFLILAVLGMMWAVYCGIRTLRTQMYEVPSMTSITNNSNAESLAREHINDVLSSHESHVRKRQISGGWLQKGEKWLGISVLLLAGSVVIAVGLPALNWICAWVS